MPQKLLQTSTQLMPEQIEVSIRTLRDVKTVLATTASTLLDCSESDYIRVSLNADTEISLTGATKDGQQIVLAIHQADTIAHSITYSSIIRLGYDIWSFPILSDTVGKLDRIIFMYDAINNKYDLIGYARGY